jgi:lactate permease
MWQQIYDPLGSAALSALLAASPILFFLVALTLLKLKGLSAALLTLALAFIVAFFGFGMPGEKILAAAGFGVLSGFWPIGAIVLLAVWLYKLAVKSGKFEVIRGSIAVISQDQRIQVILIAFCFGAFLEGAAGFGVPNAAAGAYGAIGIPVIVGAQQGGVALPDLSLMMIAIVQLSTLFVPTLLVLVLDGWRGIRETWPVLLLVGALFSIVQTGTLLVLGPELTDIIAPLVSMGALALFMQVWRPKHILRKGLRRSPTNAGRLPK